MPPTPKAGPNREPKDEFDAYNELVDENASLKARVAELEESMKSAYEDGVKVGYDDGYEKGREDAQTAHKPPLFEAAKTAVLAQPFLSREEHLAVIAEVEAEYPESSLSTADRDLLLTQAERERQRVRADEERAALKRPRVFTRTAGRPAVDGGGRSETEYTEVA